MPSCTAICLFTSPSPSSVRISSSRGVRSWSPSTIPRSLGTLDNAERGRPHPAARMTDRDHELTHAQRRRVSNHEGYDGGPGFDLQGGQVALQVACHDPPARGGTAAELDGRPIAPDDVRIGDNESPSFRLFAGP